MDKIVAKKLDYLKTNSYWGRGILIGTTNDGKIAVAYFIMGRSTNSRNRIFLAEDLKLRTKAYDESLVQDPSLIIYYPMKNVSGQLIITNGDQTDTIEEYILKGSTFEEALRTRCFEPDAPHYTPRISGIVDCETGMYKMNILKNAGGSNESCDRYFYEFTPRSGYARFIHTYMKNDEPLPSFEGEPVLFEIPETLDDLTSDIWNNLDDDNKISLCTVIIDKNTMDYEIKILNKRMGD